MISLKNNHAKALGILFVLFAAFVVFLVFITNKLKEEVTQIEEDKPPIVVAPQTQKLKKTSKKITQPVTRKTLVIRGGDFVEHWFYAGDEVLAKQRVGAHGILDTEGEIPDGRIKFVDTYKKTYGDILYLNGKPDGNATTYYESGEVKEKATYENGEKVSSIEYYADGKKRFEYDARDARNLGDDKETGIGKLYWRNGNLKYEWFMTKREPIGYKKSYNIDGGLRHAEYFDEFNQPIAQ